MYKKRQKIYKDRTLKKEEASPSADPSSPEASTVGSPKSDSYVRVDEAAADKHEPFTYEPPSRNPRSDAVLPIEIGYRTTIVDGKKNGGAMKKVLYDKDAERLIPKGAEWQVMQDDTRIEMRQILSDSFRETVSNIPGSSTNGNSTNEMQKRGEEILLPIAAVIDKELRLSLIPGKVDTKLFDPDLREAHRKAHLQLQENYKKITDFSIMVDKREAGLTPLKQELAELVEVAENRRNTRMKIREDPDDYVQMLLLHPSSEQY